LHSWLPNFSESTIEGQNFFFLEIDQYGYQKIRSFTLISKRGFLPLYQAPIKSQTTQFLGTFLKTVFWLYLLIEARYNGKNPPF
jgi:hypothetical protein